MKKMFSNPLRIHMWSGPRNVSTATMYAFRQRSDTQVVDEPLYSSYLSKVDVDHPGRQEVIASQDPDGNQVIYELIHDPCPKPVLFIKHMAHHLVGVSWDFMAYGRHFLLVRDPRAMVPSLGKVLERPTVADTGLALQLKILKDVQEFGHIPLVVDSRELLKDPRSVLEQLCRHLELPFEEEMLKWPAGPKPEDGVWARDWYASSHLSTGFIPYRPPAAEVPAELKPLLSQCLPYYEELIQYSIRATQDN